MTQEKIAYWGAVALSALSLLLIVVNIAMSNANRAMQQDVSQRQAQINQGQQIAQFNQNLVQALAEAAYKNNNLPIRDLLSSQGITLKNSDSGAGVKAAEKPGEKPVVKK